MFIGVAKHPATDLPVAVYVGRTRATGKQYDLALHQLANPFPLSSLNTREMVVDQYRRWLFQQIQVGASPIRYALLKLLDMAGTTGVVLVCHCTNELRGNECHAQVIAKALSWMRREKERTGFYPTCADYPWKEVA